MAASRAIGDGVHQEAWEDFAHVGPNDLAGRYLRRFWHPIYRAQDLASGRAKPVRLLGEDFTLYRGESGQAHALASRCAHRGTQLSTGWVESDDLRCFYHGWKYNPNGQCVEQPAEPEPFCQKIRIRSYPVCEYLGLLFVYLGEGEAPALPRYPEFEDDEEVREVVIREPWPCSFFNRIENAPDLVHLTFTHYQFGYPVPTSIEGEETEYGIETRAYYPDGKVQQVHYIMPTMSRYDVEPYTPAETRWRSRIGWRVPLDDEHYVDVLLTQVHLTGDAKRQHLEQQQQREAERAEAVGQIAILGEEILAGRLHWKDVEKHPILTEIEDYVTLVGQGAIADHKAEHIGQSDVGVILIRRLWEGEMRALAQGRPLTQWLVPDRFEVLTAIA